MDERKEVRLIDANELIKCAKPMFDGKAYCNAVRLNDIYAAPTIDPFSLIGATRISVDEYKKKR